MELKSFREFIDESKDEKLYEGKKDLSQFADTMASLIDSNDHMSARLLAAELTGNKRLIEIVKAVNNIIDFEGHNPISEYVNTVYKKINYFGEKKYGKDWDKYIYQNM